MRFIILLILLFISNFICAQEGKTIQEINALIGPKFYFDTSNINHGADLFLEEKVNKNIIINVHDTGYDISNELEKIFVLKRIGSHLSIIDSSTTFERDGKGPNITVQNDTITLQHSCSGCNFENKYKFDKAKQKYVLFFLTYSEIIKDKHPYNNVPVGYKRQSYNLRNKQFTIEIISSKNHVYKIISRKIITKLLPKDFIPDLAHFVDPLGEDVSSNIYDKIFSY